MKYLMCFSLLLIGAIQQLCGQDATQSPPLATKINSVIVYSNGARITRLSPSQTFQKGTHSVILKGLPEYFDSNSLQAQVNSQYAKVVSISVSKNYLNLFSDSEFLKAKKELDLAQFECDSISIRLSKVRQEIENVKNLSPIPPSGKNDYPLPFSMRAWQSFILFSQSNLSALYSEQRALNMQLVEATQTFNVTNAAYAKVSSKRTPKEESLLEVRVTASKEVKGEITLSYMVNNAMWRPCYDLRVNPETADLTLISYAILKQKTGEDWDNIPISFSTASPLISNVLPQLSSKIITEKVFVGDAYQSMVLQMAKNSTSYDLVEKRKSMLNKAEMSFSAPTPDQNVDNRMRMTRNSFLTENMSRRQQTKLVLNDNQSLMVEDFDIQGDEVTYFKDGLSNSIQLRDVQLFSQNIVEQDNSIFDLNKLTTPDKMTYGLDYRYDLARKEKVPSDGVMHKYLLNTQKYKGTFYYDIVSSVNSNAYMVDYMENPSVKPILEGPTNIFYGDDFIGESKVPFLMKNNGAHFYLGVDPRISVNRKVSKSTTTVGKISKERKTTLDFTVSITNNTPKTITIRASEFLPSAGESKNILVSNLAYNPVPLPSEGSQDPTIWKEEVASSKTLKINATCDIFYPLNYLISTEGYGAGFGPAIDQYTKGGK